jgi:hypothetical protein
MLKMLAAFSLLSLVMPMCSAQTAGQEKSADWRAKVADAMPLLGHRNWILIVDSAYPLQSAPGIETIETNASQLEVMRHVLSVIDRSAHVRPVISMDAELPFVSEDDAPGVSKYREEVKDLLHEYPLDSVPHERVLANVEEASRHFNILVLKTNMTIPYTSVFVRLDCRYWSADAEKRMRAKMAAAGERSH